MITLIINKEGNMATQTTKRQGVEKKRVFASGYTHAKTVHQVPLTKPFVMPDLFLEQAEDMSHFLDKNPLPQKD